MNLKEEFQNILAGQGQNSKEALSDWIDRCGRQLFDLLCGAAGEEGEFFVWEGEYWYFSHPKGEMYKLESTWDVLRNDFCVFLVNKVGFRPRDRNAKPILDVFYAQVKERAKPVRLFKFWVYDPVENAVYILRNKRDLWRVTAEEIERVKNGFNGHYGWREGSEIEIDVENSEDVLYELIGSLWLDGDPLPQQLMLRAWVMGLFFGSKMTARPLLILTGSPGSGKSTFLRTVGELLFGKEWFLSLKLGDEEDFAAAVTSDLLAGFDNVDQGFPYLDQLAGVTTGAGFKKRRRYHDMNDMVLVKPDCFVAITSYTASFGRLDISERSLVFTLERNDSRYDPEKFQQFLSRRARFWGGLVRELQQMLGRTGQECELESPIRLTEWAGWMKRVSDPADWPMLETGFEQMRSAQDEFALANDPFVEAVAALASDEVRELSTADIWGILDGRSHGLKSIDQLGRRLARDKGKIKKLIGFERVRRRYGVMYKLWRNDPVS